MNQTLNIAPTDTGARTDWSHQRAAGVLLHVSSLPSRFGIGDMGVAAFEFAKHLAATGCRFWQILPLNPTNPDAGESPYFSSSAFAGNALLIDLEALHHDGLLDAQELIFPTDLDQHNVEFERVRPLKMAALQKAARRLIQRGLPADFDDFLAAQRYWLDDYALFSALHEQFSGQSWADWPVTCRDRDPATLQQISQQCHREILETKVLQYLFFNQWEKLKTYCNQLGLLTFGDMPIYVSYDSADVWSHPEIFKLGTDRRPTMVSGVPPDYFSATGQLWNNPVYDWSALKATQYAWWVARMGALFERFDIVRIDHFRGLIQFWEVEAGAENAINGRWQDVPSYEFFDTLYAAHPDFPVVVEDLGIITPDVVAVKEHYQLPGMLVLQFAYDDDHHENPYKPHNHAALSLVYLGTHDNDTTCGWLSEDNHDRLNRLNHTLNHDVSCVSLMQMALSSRANIAILTAQDLLELPGRARMNNPSTPWDNWRWKLSDDEFTKIPFAWLKAALADQSRNVDKGND